MYIPSFWLNFRCGQDYYNSLSVTDPARRFLEGCRSGAERFKRARHRRRAQSDQDVCSAEGPLPVPLFKWVFKCTFGVFSLTQIFRSLYQEAGTK